jgi:hypothetical protein
MSQVFWVIPYNIDNLKGLFAKESGASLSIVDTKLHSVYFKEYFDELGAKTIAVENDYIDRDFLEDFSGYYVRCFQNYPRKCTRLHFFDIDFSETHFCDILAGNSESLSEEILLKAYLGFIVIKPLPQTIIGRTCLKTYPEENRRKFPIVRNYEASLFGITLQIKTLAFQEQDKVVAACATSALWSVFQSTGKLFHHPIPSPVEITKHANIYLDRENQSRNLPNKGLTAAQMAYAIRSVSLEPIFQGVANHYVLKSTLYAYLRGKIPLVLGIDLFDISDSSPEYLGKHAVAITGYSIKDTTASSCESSFSLTASRIDRIYVHDDQVGPFARMVFDDIKLSLRVSNETIERESLSTSWRAKNGSLECVRAVPDFLLIPVYHKIRIPFSLIQDVVISFNEFVAILRTKNIIQIQQLKWDIYLTTVNELKKDIINSKDINGNYRKGILLENMPRFMWRATAYDVSTRVLDLLFDATDIEQGTFFVRAIEYNHVLTKILRKVSKVEWLASIFETRPDWRIIEWFKKQPFS